MEISLKHIIGTVALLGLVISIGLSYSIITSYIDSDVKKQQLAQISEYVSLNLVEITNLVRLANNTLNPMVKTLNLPASLGENAYVTKLAERENEGYYIHTYLVSNPLVSYDSFIPYNSEETAVNFITDTDMLEVEEDRFFVGVNDEIEIIFSDYVYGGNEIVVWGRREVPDFRIQVGIGRISK